MVKRSKPTLFPEKSAKKPYVMLFLLEAQVPVALYKNGVLLTSKESIYNLGEDCNGQTYQVIWDKERRSRPQTRMSMHSRPAAPIETSNSVAPYLLDERLADGLRKRLFFVPRNQKALRESKDAADSTVFMGKKIDGGCASPISTKAAVTYAHKSHSVLKRIH
ncbi:hypothetical protein M3Y98_00465100 [Aphelenchoides besseyi]|nr:hypothetical protein M3Y98_00465100 [Aphelenchoides besseyi]